MIAHCKRIDFHLVIGAVIADPARGFRCELQQRLDSA